jgi:predicted GH43/DUF377 family glycosyl hydrolase
MKWDKLGLLFSPSGQYPWMQTHASLPGVLHLEESLYRVYFASRDNQNRSHVGYMEFDINSPTDIRSVSDRPVLAPGPLGYFDDHGVYAASIVEHKQKLFMYYIGWNPGARGSLFYSSIGLAVSEDGGLTFGKVSTAPIMARSEFDPCLVTSPCVLLDNGIWRMWYVSGFKWEEVGNKLQSYYHLKYAESTDGIQWERKGLVCIDLRPGETNIARPCVLKENGQYQMWYSFNSGQGYRIGYAESPDGYRWTRRDELVDLEPSPSGWDSEALAYPWVFTHAGRKYMLYNGNGFGRTGFGLAVEI